MSEDFNSQSVQQLVSQINKEFGTSISVDQLKGHNYSSSSLLDKLSIMVSESIADDWTTERALELLKSQIGGLMKCPTDQWNEDTLLNDMIPASGRRSLIAGLDAALGEKTEILRPNHIISGTLIVLFFACIPLAIGMDWFFSGIAMVVIGILLFILNKTGNHFKVQTLGQWAERMAWRKNLSAKRGVSHHGTQAITAKIEKLIGGLNKG